MEKAVPGVVALPKSPKLYKKGTTLGRKNFIFAEVEEKFEKLKQWLKKVEKGDVVKPPLRKEAMEKIKQCERIFNDFARRVYDHQKSRT